MGKRCMKNNDLEDSQKRERKKGRKEDCGRTDRKNGLNDKEKVDGVEFVSLQRGQLP